MLFYQVLYLSPFCENMHKVLFPIKTPPGMSYFNQVETNIGNFFSWVVKIRLHVSQFLRVSVHVGCFTHKNLVGKAA